MSKKFNDIKSGRYIVYIQTIEKMTSQTGNPMIKVNYKTIVDKDNTPCEHIITTYILFTHKKQLAEFIRCFGYSADLSMGLKDFKDKKGIIELMDNGWISYYDTAAAILAAGLSFEDFN